MVVGTKNHLARLDFDADEANWLIDPSQIPSEVGIQIRYNGTPKPGRVMISEGDFTRFRVEFKQPELAVAPGQAAVIYENERVLGGGWICG